MKKWLLFTLVVAALAYALLHTPRFFSATPRQEAPPDAMHYAAYSNREFYTGLEASQPYEPIGERVYGGIVSHHFFVEQEIAQFFLRLKGQNVKTIVIVGPNHFNAGNSAVLTSHYPYDTPWGVLAIDKTVSDQLLASGVARTEEKPFEREHSISTLVGFAKYAFPDAKFVPIIIKRSAKPQEIEVLVQKLNEILPEESLVIASVDFSHHLNRIAAAFHDEKSIAAIEQFDFESIGRLEIDSPPSITVLLRYLENRGAQKMEYRHTNSALHANNLDSEDVTSYVFAHFLAGAPKSGSTTSTLYMNGIVSGKAALDRIAGVEGNFLRGTDAVVTSSFPRSLNDLLVSQSLAVGVVAHENKTKFYLFPFRNESGLPKMLPYNEASNFCAGFVKNMKQTDVCVFEL